MAKPIEPTPTIKGEDAKRFLEAAKRAVQEPLTEKESLRIGRKLKVAFGTLTSKRRISFSA